jgi:hypothetical protein
VVDDGDAIAELVRLVHVVGGQEHGEVLRFLDAPEHLPDGGARHRIEPGRGLVEEEDARFVHEAAGDLHPPAHAAREGLDRLVGPGRELDGLEELGDQPFSLCARHAVELGEDEQVLLGAQLGVAGERLRDDADAPAHAVGIEAHVGAPDHGGARGGRDEGRHHADESRLARAVRTQQPEDLPLLDGESDAVDGGEVAEALDDALDVDRVSHGRSRRQDTGKRT